MYKLVFDVLSISYFAIFGKMYKLVFDVFSISYFAILYVNCIADLPVERGKSPKERLACCAGSADWVPPP